MATSTGRTPSAKLSIALVATPPGFAPAKRRKESEGRRQPSFGSSIVKERSKGMRGGGGRPARRATRECTREPDKPGLPTRPAPRYGATPHPVARASHPIHSGTLPYGPASIAGSGGRREVSGWTAVRIRAGRRPRKRPEARAETPAVPPRVPRRPSRTPRSAEPVRTEARRRARDPFAKLSPRSCPVRFSACQNASFSA